MRKHFANVCLPCGRRRTVTCTPGMLIQRLTTREPDEEMAEHFTDSYGAIHKQPVLISYNREKYEPIAISPFIPFRVFGRVLK